jgi:hypothetical protein
MAQLHDSIENGKRTLANIVVEGSLFFDFCDTLDERLQIEERGQLLGWW